MLNLLRKKSVLSIATMMTLIMFIIVMFVVNPFIDGKNGMGVLALQLAFNKQSGMEIINSWGLSGIENFNQFIFTDYLYAISYSLFFASILSILILKKSKENLSFIIYIPFMAGVLDWIENTIEVLFINNPIEFSDTLFFIHSIVASLKWLCVPVVLIFIIKLSLLNNGNPNKPL